MNHPLRALLQFAPLSLFATYAFWYGAPTPDRWVQAFELGAVAALERVGLGKRLDHHPSMLSGGQQQRVAIARAVITDPTILVADEPTGDLDRVSAEDVLNLMDRLNSELGKTIVMVTHDPNAAKHARTVRHLEKGVLTEG